MFLRAQELYSAEGIAWAEISYTDNASTISLLRNKPKGILPLIDDVRMPAHSAVLYLYVLWRACVSSLY